MAAHAKRGPAGSSPFQPVPAFAWVIAASVLVHAALLSIGWRSKERVEPSTATRMSLRLLASKAPTVVVAPATTPAPVAARRAAAPARARTVAKPPIAHQVAVAPPMAAPPPVINGSVFGMPRIGFSGPAAARRTAPNAFMQSMPSSDALAQMQAQAARHAGLAQIMLALQQQVTGWAAPLDASEGTCSLDAQHPLRCDSNALEQIVSERAAPLVGLLDAVRGLEPRAASLSVAFVQGRYRVSWELANELR